MIEPHQADPKVRITGGPPPEFDCIICDSSVIRSPRTGEWTHEDPTLNSPYATPETLP